MYGGPVDRKGDTMCSDSYIWQVGVLYNKYRPLCILVFAGTFGQSERWNLSHPSTYQHPKLPNETIFDTQGLPNIDTRTASKERAGSDWTAGTSADEHPINTADSVVSVMWWCCAKD